MQQGKEREKKHKLKENQEQLEKQKKENIEKLKKKQQKNTKSHQEQTRKIEENIRTRRKIQTTYKRNNHKQLGKL